MWFLIIAPQRKRQKQHDQMIAELKSGDDIITSGGIFGTITNVKEDCFVVRIADNTKLKSAAVPSAANAVAASLRPPQPLVGKKVSPCPVIYSEISPHTIDCRLVLDQHYATARSTL